jgi:hypothetical protein
MGELWRQVLPVLISILIIVSVAVLRAHSRTLAAITATMPLNIALASWIVYANASGDRTQVVSFIGDMALAILGTVVFILALWVTARAGWRLGPMLIAGYAAWGLTLGAVMSMRYLLGG